MFSRILITIFSMCLFAVTGAKAEVICNQKSKVTNIRMGPSAKNYGIADTLKNGDQIKVLERVTNPDGYDYFKVKFRHTQTGKKTTAFVYNEAVSNSCSSEIVVKSDLPRAPSSNSQERRETFFGCDFVFVNAMTNLSWASTLAGFELKGLNNPKKFFYGRLCRLAKGKAITMLNVHKDGSFDKASNGYEIAYYRIGGCKSSIEFGIKNGKSVEVIVHYPRDCNSNQKKVSNSVSANSDKVCYQIRNEDARYACLKKPFLTQNEDSRKILQGNCYNLSKLAKNYKLDQVCARGKSACYELTQDKWRQSCFSCEGTKRWAATAIAGSVLTCYK